MTNRFLSFHVVGVCQATKPSARTHNNGGVWLYDVEESFLEHQLGLNGGVWLYDGVERFSEHQHGLKENVIKQISLSSNLEFNRNSLGWRYQRLSLS